MISRKVSMRYKIALPIAKDILCLCTHTDDVSFFYFIVCMLCIGLIIASKWVSMLRTMYIRHMCIHIKSICTERLCKFICSFVHIFNILLTTTLHNPLYIKNTNWHYQRHTYMLCTNKL